LTISPGGVTVVPRGYVFPEASAPPTPPLSRDREAVLAAALPVRPR
jgi:hypothetical protein